MRPSVLLAFVTLAGACAVDKPAADDRFDDLAAVDGKSDVFSSAMKIVATVGYAPSTTTVAYQNPPRYRAVEFHGQPGDTIDAWVRSQQGDAIAWLLDGHFKILAKNDDADGATSDSHIALALPPSKGAGTYYIVFREFHLAPAIFTVEFTGRAAVSPSPPPPPTNFFACAGDDDCVAVPEVACCQNGYLAAVNRNEVHAYETSFTCSDPHPICSHLMVNDTRVAECNGKTHVCEMVAIDAIQCGGFILHPHDCPRGYHCQLPMQPDIPGSCVPN